MGEVIGELPSCYQNWKLNFKCTNGYVFSNRRRKYMNGTLMSFQNDIVKTK